MCKINIVHLVASQLVRFRTLFYSIYFNFRVLPFREAICLPFCCKIWPTITVNKGKVLFVDTAIKKYMIKLGVQRTPILTSRSFVWSNAGTIVFKGRVSIGHHVLIKAQNGAYLEFGDQVGLNSGCRIICQKKIIFNSKVRVSWDCQFYDTNFHPLIDMLNEKPVKMRSPIIIGKNVWIGHNVIVSKGVKLADGIIVSSGSVVKNIFNEPNCIILGNPAVKVSEGYKAEFDDFR